MAVEVATYRYVLRGKPVGTHIVKREPIGRYVQLEARSQFQGIFGNLTTVQRSRAHSRAHFSTRYEETNEVRREKRNFEMSFDIVKGLVSASKGPRDVAEMPYVLPYRDPLSLLNELRNPDIPDLYRIPMVGKEVVVRVRGTTTIETIFGDTECVVYQLLPGPSYVYVMANEPHHIVKLMQPSAEGVLEVLLQKLGQEARSTQQEASPRNRRQRGQVQAQAQGKGGGTRRRRPRRRRPSKPSE